MLYNAAVRSANNEFQFPSNGKDFPNEPEVIEDDTTIYYSVSIPFKREGLSELGREGARLMAANG